MSDSVRPHGLQPTRLLCPWDFPGKSAGVGAIAFSDSLYSPWNSPGQNAGVGSLSLLQGTFPTQGSKPGLLHCRQILYIKTIIIINIVQLEKLRFESDLPIVSSASQQKG